MNTEHHGLGISAVLAADANFKVAAGLASLLERNLDQLADTVGIEHRKRIFVEDVLLLVVADETAGVITGETEGGLS